MAEEVLCGLIFHPIWCLWSYKTLCMATSLSPNSSTLTILITNSSGKTNCFSTFLFWIFQCNASARKRIHHSKARGRLKVNLCHVIIQCQDQCKVLVRQYSCYFASQIGVLLVLVSLPAILVTFVGKVCPVWWLCAHIALVQCRVRFSSRLAGMPAQHTTHYTTGKRWKVRRMQAVAVWCDM